MEQGLVARGSELLEKVLDLLKKKPDALSRAWEEKAYLWQKQAKLQKSMEKETDWIYNFGFGVLPQAKMIP